MHIYIYMYIYVHTSVSSISQQRVESHSHGEDRLRADIRDALTMKADFAAWQVSAFHGAKLRRRRSTRRRGAVKRAEVHLGAMSHG